MRRRPPLAAFILCGAAALTIAVPSATIVASTASFSDTQTATDNVATAGTCSPSSNSWNTLVTSTSVIPSSSRDVYNRLSGASTLVDVGGWSGGTWSTTSMSLSQSGALYCDGDTAISANSTTDRANTATQAQSTYFTSGTTSRSTVMFWVNTTSTVAGRLASVGNSTSSDRVIWLDSTGVVHFSARSNGTSTSWSITGGSPINDGRWHLIVVSMGTVASSGGGATLYVDGSSVATQAAGSAYAFRTGSRFGTSSSVAWTLGSQTAATTPTGAPTAGAAPTSYDEFVQFDTTNLSATLLGTGAGSLFRSADV
jgi:hypothetical protein